MIYTLTLNPALDVSGTVDELIPDEKSYVHDEIHSPGGNGINAGVIAHRLGAKIMTWGFLGGSHGQEIKDCLKQLKIRHRFIAISGNTRMNLTVHNKKTSKQTRLSFPGPFIKKSEMTQLSAMLGQVKTGDLVVIGGSLPPGVKPKYVADLVKKINLRGSVCIVDIPGNHLSKMMSAKPYFIKPNLTEFQALIGKKLTTIKSILPLVLEMNKKVPLICVSSIEGGAILVRGDEAWYGKIPKVKIRSTVGAGDSMVGAISYLLEKKPDASVEELLRMGLAASCATLTERGMVLGTKESIHYYLPKITLRQISF